MKKLLSYTTLCVSLLTLPLSMSAVSPLEQTVFCEISKIIIGVLANPGIAHPSLIVRVLIKKMRILLSDNHSQRVADLSKVTELCKRLEAAVENKQGAYTILSLLQEMTPFLSSEALDRLRKISKGQQMCLLNKFSQQMKQAPQGTVENVEALFKC